jgi:tripartite-type tricarboxylate transporter receptor subunit TctC
MRSVSLPAVLVLACLATPAIAQSWPTKPVRLIVPYPAGGSTDIIARTVAARLSEQWGQSVVVDNRAGGGTVIGTDLVAKSPPDGYTLLVVPAPFTINPSLLPKLPYDTLADFTPITLINTTPLVVVVNPSVPARTVKELLALARANPGKLNFGSSGTGGSNHLAGELFGAMGNVKMVHIPYKGNAPALTDLVGGHVDVLFNGLTSAIALIKAAKIRAIAITSTRRSDALPDLPTVDEAGLKGYEAGAWNGLAGPARTPREVVQRVQADVGRTLGAPELRERLRAEGSDPVGSSPEDFAKFIRTETEKWGKVVKFAKVKPE